MRHLVAEAGMDGEIEIESAGTGSWHAGEPADRRSAAAAERRGYQLESIARQVTLADFEEFDLLVAMDRSNHADLLELAPPHAEDKVRLLREFDEQGAANGDLDVPDPYFGAHDGFAEVLGIVERCCAGLLDEVSGDR